MSERGKCHMMSKTHITVGVAASLAVCMPSTVGGVISAVIGGAIGGILCDIECKSTPKVRDALYGRLIAAGLTGILLLTDIVLNTGLWISIISRERFFLGLGAIVIIVTCLIGRFSRHRTFTHSLLYVLLISFGFFCITPELLFPVLSGGISHLIIDTFNKKPIPWLYPLIKRGICFKICNAGKIGNTIMMWLGLVASVALLSWRIMVITGKI